jgi:hypothetical protein
VAEKLPNREVLLAEYAAANSIYLTYDGFRWQAGSFLVAGVFVYWGFVLGSSASAVPLGVSSLLVCALMSCWLLFAHHYRQLYLLKLVRLHEIEARLGMEQHRRFVPGLVAGPAQRAFGPRGHNLDRLVYVLTSLGGGAIAASQGLMTWWLLSPVPIVVATLAWVAMNERRITRVAHARWDALRAVESAEPL